MVPVQSQLNILWLPSPSVDGINAVTSHFSLAKSNVSNLFPSHGDGTNAVTTQHFLAKSDGSNPFPSGDGINAITTQHSSAALVIGMMIRFKKTVMTRDPDDSSKTFTDHMMQEDSPGGSNKY